MKTLMISIKFLILMTVLTGFIYPAAITLISKFIYPEKAGGSFISNHQDQTIGSSLIAQNFKADKYFWPRPSAVDFNPAASGGSNLGPTSSDLLTQFKARQKQGFTHEMLFTSGSGLDPHISPEAAYDQLKRVATSRGKSESEMKSLVNEYSEPRQFGFLGQNRVNVLKLNLALDERD